MPSAVGEEALRGLTSRPKTLPSWMFYDSAGSELFERITRLPEYYLTRTERSIFTRFGSEIIAAAGALRPPDFPHDPSEERLNLIELGAGSAEKTGVLIEHALRQAPGVLYEPVDVSRAALRAAAARLRARWPNLRVRAIEADYTNGFRLRQHQLGRQIVLWIGSSMGNFEHTETRRILSNVRQQLRAGDALLLGADLAPSKTKSAETIIRAYDDSAGVTAGFNHNILQRLNRELGADFDSESFRHIAHWNPLVSRMEMYLESAMEQQVTIPALHLKVRFFPGERIHTENSYKYRPGQLESIVSAAGFTAERMWNDPEKWFAVLLARAE